MTDTVYMDHNATTTVRPEAASAVCEALALTGNASSVHRHGRLARRLIEDARDEVAALVGASPNDVIFTGCGTEANNLALLGVAVDHRFVSAIEHPSVLQAADGATPLAVDDNGIIDLAALQALLSAASGRSLVSVMLANNETGVIQPVADVVRIAEAHGALVHCDAVQAAGKMAVDMGALGVDLLSLSAHKIGGPQGVGALLVKPGLEIKAQLKGGGQERRLRAGTENVAGIAGFGAAAKAVLAGLEAMAELASWRDLLVTGVRQLTHTRVYGEAVDRLPNTVCLAMPGVPAETQLMAFDLAGVCVSAGSACSSGKIEPSHVLAAMGVNDDEALTAIRVSLGWNSKKADIDRFVDAWGAIFARAGNGQTRAMAG
ncbi:MAG: cysteine desulfurase [Rhodospirillales bacterium]|nr:cysteine desulfurase [Rhodospirillales bacterium]